MSNKTCRIFAGLIMMATTVFYPHISTAQSAAVPNVQVHVDRDLVLRPFSKGKGALYGYLDKTAKDWVIQPKFDAAAPFYPEFDTAIVKENKLAGLIDKSGQYIVAPQFSRLKAIVIEDINYYIAEKDKKVGLLDARGNWMFEPKFDRLGAYPTHGLLLARNNKKSGYVDITGKTIIEFKFDKAADFSQNKLAAAQHGKLWGYIDTSGAWVIQPKFKSAKTFYEGRAAVKHDNKYGFIDEAGTFVVPAIYDSASGFYNKNGLTRVKKGTKEGVIDRKGRIVIPLKYGDVRLGKTQLTRRVKKKQGIQDLKGNWILKPTYSTVGMFWKGELGSFYIGNHQGCMNKEGRVVVPAVFNSVRCHDDGPMKVSFNGNQKSGFVKKYGWPHQFTYEDLNKTEKSLCNKKADKTPLLSLPSAKSGVKLRDLYNGRVLWVIEEKDYGSDKAPFKHVAVGGLSDMPTMTGFVPKRALSSKCDLLSAQSAMRLLKKHLNKSYTVQETLRKQTSAPEISGKTVKMDYTYSFGTRTGNSSTLANLCSVQLAVASGSSDNIRHNGKGYKLQPQKTVLTMDFAADEATISSMGSFIQKAGSKSIYGEFQHGTNLAFSPAFGAKTPLSQNKSRKTIYVGGKVVDKKRLEDGRDHLFIDVPPNTPWDVIPIFAQLEKTCRGKNTF
ncbi:MAG: WG repeat-containing protein [Halocynthiibacter sp.]